MMIKKRIEEPFLKPIRPLATSYKKRCQRFYCPLCGTERFLRVSARLSFFRYLQILFASAVVIMASYPFMEWKAFFLFFLVWGVVEVGQKMNFRKEVVCPHCGFDATWYRKDVKVARKLVDDYWVRNALEKKGPPQTNLVQENDAPPQEELPINNSEVTPAPIEEEEVSPETISTSLERPTVQASTKTP